MQNYASYVTFTQKLCINNAYYAQIMHKLCILCINYVLIMHKLCTLCKNYAKITQKLRKNYAKKLHKNYAYVCKLHNLHYYAPPTLLMEFDLFGDYLDRQTDTQKSFLSCSYG